MSKIIDVKNAVITFLQENTGGENIMVTKLEKIVDEWNATAEVYEDDSFLKSMNLPAKKNRVFYSVRLDDALEITGFERMDG